ncbi:putative HTH-type transcriptional regulator YwqM [Paenibacillus illinoisensis]|uniref:Putative HTH-type transcriptional regulator YwqM n=1 Tax=Paenibacillus illinoisensis TaxID=59845 RepID=A0A2W0C1U7_9BACL|nr:putative HTH-type transcriptional regulator YwqM [Paenibacillus illinoisensis]
MLDEPIRSSGLSVEPLLEEHFRLLAAPDHPLAKRTVLQLEDFHGEVFLTNERVVLIERCLIDRLRKRALIALHM